MQEQLRQVYQDSLKSMLGGAEADVGNMEQHLKTKAAELNRLQACFQREIVQMQSQQRKQNLYRRVITSILSTFGYFRGEIQHIKRLWLEVVDWRDDVQAALRQLPSVFEKTVQSIADRGRVKLSKRSTEANEGELKRVEIRFKQQIEKQSQTIVYLENVLRNLSSNKKDVNASSACLLKRNPSQHLRSHDVNVLSANSISPLRERKNSTTKEKPRSPVRCLQQRTLIKEEVIEKIRRYQQAKSTNENLNVSQKKSCHGGSYQKLLPDIPNLPELKINIAFPFGATNGFDVMMIDGKEVYKGMWKRGVFEGRGKFYAENWIYDGEFRGGVIEGFGTLNFKGWTFTGRFQKGYAQGEGTLYGKEKPVCGIWRDNVLVKEY